jgi:ABC-type transport system involved in multi-copper enzyme maturation permease subunit
MLSNHVRHEVRTAVRAHHLAMLLGLAVLSVGLSFGMPRFPPAVYRFFLKVFAMRSWTEIIVVNDLMGLLFGLYWIGVVDLLRVYVVPREEGFLDILLSKPIGRTQYLFARVLPSFAVIGAVGAVLSLFLPLKIALINGTADLDVAGVFCTGLATTAAALVLLALLNLVFLYTRETYHAVTVAVLLYMAAAMPGAVFMYRPDVYAAHPLVRSLLVFPPNLLWFSAMLPRWMPGLVLAAVGVTAVLLAAGGRRLQRVDVG